VCDLCLCGCVTGEICQSKPRTLHNLEQQISDIFATVPLDFFLTKLLSLCLACYRSVYKVLGPVVKSATKWQCMGLQMVQELS
jgi:hypothetical protein